MRVSGIKMFAVVMAVFLASSASFAAETPVLPDSLFDVKLGGIYKIGKGKHPYDVGNLPVKKFTAIQRYLGSGLHYFFKPLKEHRDFNYIERRYYENEEHYETSFRLYLLPVIRGTVALKDLKSIEWDWAVMLIEWSSQAERKEDAYRWAMDLCDSTKLDLQREPSVSRDAALNEYSCVFKEGDKKLEIKVSGFAKSYKLSRTQLAMDQSNDAVEAAFRKLRVSELNTR